MLKIYVARHGQNKDNAAGILNGHRDEPLTEVGIGQAYELANGIKKMGLTFDHVYSSPLSRAHKTAEIVCETLGIQKPVVLPELIERDFGIMTGKSAKDIESLCGVDIIKTNTITYFLSPEDAETFPDLLARARRVLSDVCAKHSSGSILLATHGDFGKMLYTAYYNLDWRDILTMFHFGNSELLLLAEDSKAEDSHILHIKQHNH